MMGRELYDYDASKPPKVHMMKTMDELTDDHPAWAVLVYGAELLVRNGYVSIVFKGAKAREQVIDMGVDVDYLTTFLDKPAHAIIWPGTVTKKGVVVWTFWDVPIVIESEDCTHPICQNYGHCQHPNVGSGGA